MTSLDFSESWVELETIVLSEINHIKKMHHAYFLS